MATATQRKTKAKPSSFTITTEELDEMDNEASAELANRRNGKQKTKTAKHETKPVVLETDDELLAISLSYGGIVGPHTDDELLAKIKKRWTQAKVFTKRHYMTDVTHPTFGVAIWFSDSTAGHPAYFHDEDPHTDIIGNLLENVRRVMKISDKTAASFAELKKNGKSRPKEISPGGPPVYAERSIELSLIDDSPFQTRDEPSKESIAALAESIKSRGLRDKPIVREKADGRFELIGGHRRSRACRLLKWERLPVRVLVATDAEAAALVFEDNESHEALNAVERARGLNVIYEQYQAAGKSMRQMADDVGISQGTISNRIRILQLPDVLLQRLISGEITEAMARQIPPWLDYPLVVENFVKELDGDVALEGTISTFEWEDALERAIQMSSRRVKRVSMHPGYTGDPIFNVESHREALQIVEVKIGKYPVQERAMNCVEWDRLQKEAKKNDKKKTQSKSKSTKPATEPRTDRDGWSFRNAMRDAWVEPLWLAIGKHVTEGKLTKPQKQVACRLLALIDSPPHDWIVESLAMTADEYTEAVLDFLRVEWADGCGWNIQFEDLAPIAELYGIDVVSTWKPTESLLKACALDDLQEIDATVLSEAGVDTTISKDQLIESMLKAWKPGYVPELLAIEPPKSKPTKKSTARR